MLSNKKSLKIFLTSSVAKKYIMAVTGLFLIVFLLVHASLNALIFVGPRDGEVFNKAAHFMSTNRLMGVLELGLLLGFVIHIVQAVLLTKENKAARKVGYKQDNKIASTWYSRSMGLLGTIILIFLILHLYHFWTKTKFGFPNDLPVSTSGVHDLWSEMKLIFSNPYVVTVYVLACISLGYHLLHGFHSAFQSVGLRHYKYTPIIKVIGYIYAILISLLFISMPLYVYFFATK